jgi:signal transduction histidine kinase
VIRYLAPIAGQKRVGMALSAQENLTMVSDETLLRLLLENIIENAVKYTPEGGAVDIYLSGNEKQVHIVVNDTGPGIPEIERAQVFERFYRVGTPQARGTGLGLAIVSEILSRLGGTIQLLTAHAGQGLRVEISLPRDTHEPQGVVIR